MEIVERRILSIDGGGLKGACPAAFLASIEEQIGRPVADYFDLITGTSTGGIIALGLGLGMKAREILTMYEELGPKVFNHHSALGTLKRITGAEYNPAPLEEVLRARFGQKTLADSHSRLIITSVDVATGRPVRFRTPHHPHYTNDAKMSAVDVALATTAAPTYLPVHISEIGLPMVDGGLWAADPVEVAVIEAIGVLNWPRKHVKVLSLGCTGEAWDPGKLADPSHQGTKDWLPKIFGLRTRIDSLAALENVRMLLKPKALVRIDPAVPSNFFGIDRPGDLPQLCLLGRSVADECFPSLSGIFFETVAKPYKSAYAYQETEEAIPTP